MERKAVHEVMPKTSYDRTDGSGRDIYIAYNNGGTFQPMMKLKSYDKICIRPKSTVSQSSLRSLHYVSDGTGRDSYIKTSDGGLHSSISPASSIQNFRSNLRDYQPFKIINDPYTWSQSNWKTNKMRAYSKQHYRKIAQCVSRLYKTKL